MSYLSPAPNAAPDRVIAVPLTDTINDLTIAHGLPAAPARVEFWAKAKAGNKAGLLTGEYWQIPPAANYSGRYHRRGCSLFIPNATEVRLRVGDHGLTIHDAAGLPLHIFTASDFAGFEFELRVWK